MAVIESVQSGVWTDMYNRKKEPYTFLVSIFREVAMFSCFLNKTVHIVIVASFILLNNESSRPIHFFNVSILSAQFRGSPIRSTKELRDFTG